MKASAKQQQALLVMQKCDTALARLTYDAQHLPEHEQLRELKQAREVKTREIASLQANLSDYRREASKVANDVERMQARIEVLNQRLDASAGSPKELANMQEELDNVTARLDLVMEKQWEGDDELKKQQAQIDSIRTESENLSQQINELTAKRDAQIADLQSQAQPLIDERKAHMVIAGPELTREYDAIRKSTGGIGAVALRGRSIDGMSVQFTPAEWDRIRKAPSDEVLVSEDHEWIMVRVDD
ncbi:hypothetical protein BK816_05170 [Boudabousia tangfeifanii]|uniref:CT398-like coiled coil hairpin domain-containing protein n=1 Tax=Boudabousia tangfeifanii TaxID=1912795 RepID=A0A1D9MKP5_9ACTO|nr:hypothetical protein [Boudabousia tangfeifanii]AOZ72759.1 hypothetical protein BK816_05170 [Boudabousia tangfeifanii]